MTSMKLTGIDYLRLTLNSLKTMRLPVLWQELTYRLKSPDGLPLPPARYIFWVTINVWRAIYFHSGQIITADIKSHLQTAGLDLANFRTLLDFGCGCGRISRHLAGLKSTTLFGVDYNPELVAWCSKNLPFGRFSQNELEPPLQFDDNMFDFILARSVFCCFGEDLQRRWLAELWRVLKPGGILYLSTHGSQFVAHLPPEQKELYDAGEMVTVSFGPEGSNNFGSFHPNAYVTRRMLTGFELLSYKPGEAKPHLEQDNYILRKKA